MDNFDRLALMVALAVLLLAAWMGLRLIGWLLAWLFLPNSAKRLPGAALDAVLMQWTPQDHLSLRDLLNGGCVIFGRPGSGKSSSSSFQLLKAVSRLPDAGGLILAASPGDLALCKRAFGREAHRLVVFDASGGHRFNALSFLLACGAPTKDLLAAIYAIAETVARGGGQGGDDDNGSFFSKGARRVIENAIIVVKNATGDVRVADLMAFLNSAASTLAEVHDPEFQTSFHWQCLKQAYEADKSPIEQFDYELARAFFTQELPRMADRTRTSLIAVVMNILHVFNSGINRLLFATDTTISPALMNQGKFIFVNTPIGQFGQEGAFALGVWKFISEWYALRRDSTQDNPPLIIHADEFHNTINHYDTRFLGECRKFSACMIACSQSKASFYANMGGEAAEAQVDALLNNFSHKIIHALGDTKTAEWASHLVGVEMQLNLGGSEQQPASLLDALMGVGTWSASFSETPRPILEARHFMHGFRTGGQRNGYVCDAVVIRSGEPFNSGDNFLTLAFSQK